MGQSSPGLLCCPIRFSMCPSREKSVCQGPLYKPEKTACLQRRSSAETNLGSEDSPDSGPSPLPEALATPGFRVQIWKAPGPPAQQATAQPPVWWALRRAVAHTVPRTEGPCPWSSHSREEMDKSESRCRGRSKQYAHCDGSLYVATWLGLGAPTLGCSGCCCEALLGAANM